MAPIRRSRQARANRWYRHNAVGGQQEVAQDTISGERVRRVHDSYCPFCASDIRSVGPRNIVRCPNVGICGKVLPIDSNSCPNCCHYTRPGDNFCRVCRSNLRNVVRGHGGLYQQIGRAPSPFQNTSPPRQEAEPPSQPDSEEEGEGDRYFPNVQAVVVPPADVILPAINDIINQANQAVNQQQEL